MAVIRQLDSDSAAPDSVRRFQPPASVAAGLQAAIRDELDRLRRGGFSVVVDRGVGVEELSPDQY
jgi:hypothetical protein